MSDISVNIDDVEYTVKGICINGNTNLIGADIFRQQGYDVSGVAEKFNVTTM